MISLLRKWSIERKGSTAIEFSLLSIPYLFLTIGIIELSIMYAAASMLEGATGSAARLIRTGQIQQATMSDPEEMFRDQLCGYAQALINCNNIQTEVVTLVNFSDANDLAPAFDDNGEFVPAGFNAGGVSDRILIRTVYTYDMMTPLVGPLLSGGSGTRIFMSSIILQTEPYEFTEAG